jgi:hypothetical protein
MKEFTAWAVDSLIGVSAKEVALCLQEVCRKALRSVAIKECKCCSYAWSRNA